MQGTPRIRTSDFLSGPQRAVFIPPRSALDECFDEIERWWNTRSFKGKFAGLLNRQADHVQLVDADFRCIVEATCTLRNISDIRWQIASFKADTMHRFKAKLAAVAWPFPAAARIKVKTSSVGSRLYHEARLTESAEKILRQSAASSSDERKQAVFLQLKDNHINVLLSLRGTKSMQRNYISAPSSNASMRAPLVASIIFWHRTWLAQQGFDVDQPSRIWNPFCGSGVFAFEYAAQVLNIPHHLLFRQYAFEDWDFIPSATKQHFLKRPKLHHSCQVILQDTDRKQVEAAQEHALNLAPLQINGNVSELDFFSGNSALDDAPLAICANPPFGDRLKPDGEIPAFFRKIGERIVNVQAEVRLSCGVMITPSPAAAEELTQVLRRRFLVATKAFRTGGKPIVVVSWGPKS